MITPANSAKDSQISSSPAVRQFSTFAEPAKNSKKTSLSFAQENPRPIKKLKAPTDFPAWATTSLLPSSKNLACENTSYDSTSSLTLSSKSISKSSLRTPIKATSCSTLHTTSARLVSADHPSQFNKKHFPSFTNSKGFGKRSSAFNKASKLQSTLTSSADYSNTTPNNTNRRTSLIFSTKRSPKIAASSLNFQKARSVFQKIESPQPIEKSPISLKKKLSLKFSATSSPLSTPKTTYYSSFSSSYSSSSSKNCLNTGSVLSANKSHKLPVNDINLTDSNTALNSLPQINPIHTAKPSTNPQINNTILDKLKLLNSHLNKKFDFIKNENLFLKDKIKDFSFLNKALNSLFSESIHEMHNEISISNCKNSLYQLYNNLLAINKLAFNLNRKHSNSGFYQVLTKNHYSSFSNQNFASKSEFLSDSKELHLDNSDTSNLLESVNKQLSILLPYLKQSNSSAEQSNSSDTILASELENLSLQYENSTNIENFNHINNNQGFKYANRSSASLKTLKSSTQPAKSLCNFNESYVATKPNFSQKNALNIASRKQNLFEHVKILPPKPPSGTIKCDDNNSPNCSCANHFEAIKALMVDNDFYRADNKNLQLRLENLTRDFNKLAEKFQENAQHAT
ncbi:hypothetical protein BB561_001260 [Smittium simulii]|uniref:Uncharacterized protein n=1 Tax=Smittium simulii TaxID=133385 RepID=A0A2T9YVD4_9FUNG|nr:hypothetical protein BB561_001260 [Smittium simulii]